MIVQPGQHSIRADLLKVEQPVLTVACGWCGKVMRQGDSELVSHSICPSCAAAFTARPGS